MFEQPSLDEAFPTKIESPTAVVHLEYDPTHLPPRPGPQWTRFVCISDTHSRVFPVPDGDVLLHSGDLTSTGRLAEFQVTTNWLYSLPHPTKIIIAGNHDLTLHRVWYETNFQGWHRNGMEKVVPILKLLKGKKAQEAGIVYLEDEKYEFQAKKGGRLWSVWGSPWSPYFHGWAFNYHRGEEAENIISKIPQTDILLTHSPPYNILDETNGEEYVGCESLAARLESGSLRPRLHLFGHIHEAHGAEIRTWAKSEPTDSDQNDSERKDNADCTAFVNAANWPMGPRSRALLNAHVKTSFGGPGFRPVIVDLLDTV